MAAFASWLFALDLRRRERADVAVRREEDRRDREREREEQKKDRAAERAASLGAQLHLTNRNDFSAIAPLLKAWAVAHKFGRASADDAKRALNDHLNGTKHRFHGDDEQIAHVLHKLTVWGPAEKGDLLLINSHLESYLRGNGSSAERVMESVREAARPDRVALF